MSSTITIKMKKKLYNEVNNYMLNCLKDSCHDKDHVYRVLYTALSISETFEKVDTDILIVACLLHDIARPAEIHTNSCHALLGAQMAVNFLMSKNLSLSFCAAVQHCISTHRFRSDNPPTSIEAKILYDADKIDSIGALGIARTLMYKGFLKEPLYCINNQHLVESILVSNQQSFIYEYLNKLSKIGSKLFTQKGRALAAQRQLTSSIIFEALIQELADVYEVMAPTLSDFIN